MGDADPRPLREHEPRRVVVVRAEVGHRGGDRPAERGLARPEPTRRRRRVTRARDDREPEAEAAAPTAATQPSGKPIGRPPLRASIETRKVKRAVAPRPTTPTQNDSSSTISRSEPIETPSARREANSLMLARMAPRSVWEVMPTPIRKPRNTEKPRKMPMICSFISALSLAWASSARVQAR